MLSFPRALLGALCLVVPSPSQESPAALPFDSTCGLVEADGMLLAVGPDYRARFDRGFEFTPALGESAPRDLPLALTLASIGRRDGATESRTPSAELGAMTTRTLPRGVELTHGEWLVERYALRRDGIEQSFVFQVLPPGRGDLVVRLDVETSLEPSQRDRVVRELTFAQEGIGGVHVGAVTGIDARGRRTAGSMRFAGGTLELILPGAFVDDAALPLVLDPLFGTRTVVRSGGTMRQVDSAYDATNDEFLLVWEQVLSSSNSDIFARRLHSDGTTRGAVFAVRSTSSRRSRAPRVANVAARDAFVVVWHETPTSGSTNWDVMARRVNAGATGGLSSTITVGGGAGTQIDPDVGGASGTQDYAQVVWVDRSRGSALWAAGVRLGTGTGIGLLAPREVWLGSVKHNPRIASSGGDASRHLVVWRSERLCTQEPCEIHALLIDRNRSPIGQPILVHRLDVGFVDVDGDGERWLAAFELNTSFGRAQIGCRALEYDAQGGGLRLGVGRSITALLGNHERAPSVARLSGEEEYLVGYLDEIDTTSVFASTVATVDPVNCRVCEFDTMTVTSGNSTSVSVVAGGVDGEGLLASIRGTNLFAQPYRSENGIVTDLGGGCGLGGTAHVFCARLGNFEFEHHVLGARSNQSAWLLLSGNRFDRRVPGFACDFVPNPFLGFALYGGLTSATGRAVVSLSIPHRPELAGLRLVEQWLVGTELSNALRFEIQ